MRSPAATALLVLGLLGLATAADPPLPRLQGFVTDDAGVISPAERTRLTGLIEELREKTGAEIAVVTVQTTAPLDDFTYAMRLAEAWKPGRKGEDTGVVFLVAVRDRRLRVLVGYGLEGILPDGLVGAIQDEEVVPRFRAGRVGEGIWHGVAALASRIADARGVTLTGAPARRPGPPPPQPIPLPLWVVALVLLLIVAFMLYHQASSGPSHVPRRRRGIYPTGWGPFDGYDGGFSGGGGGFGGFGGGSFGGGGAGRSW
jgi:uncharacterized protein